MKPEYNPPDTVVQEQLPCLLTLVLGTLGAMGGCGLLYYLLGGR